MQAQRDAFDVNKLLVGFVDILASGNAMPLQFDRLARDLGIAEGAPMVVFLNGIKKILRALPDKAFEDKNARLAMVDAVQDALDQAIDVEEEMNENNQQGDS
ncbi:TyeA family type III secretion system gatekeeper subunit [Caenimonas koreensis DSM 17982]|uniref:TyeA family type III secretion system gatekeeper subunit n=1 Tax=Caenimonas koreensis DSM 17982 TaxID=1121255 RepID=A0A844AS05_9BURK|nr:TyeA family type III secretion system gatekeeper subunit [Caenimonas koreensis]MRD47065.1 TyeA family type III secretion system gatekeeper subunit [Caenimonas koreensis DSM 17982]